jgi:hypothetical protein
MKLLHATIAVALLPLFQVTAAHEDGARWWLHVKYLADDSMQGRETGSAGYMDAARYVAAEFERAGLAAAGSQAYFQPVRFRTRKVLDEGTSITIDRDGGSVALQIGDDAIVGARVDTAPATDAEMVFAGYGLTIPEAHYDDFAGLDVKGKVVVYLAGAPPKVPGPLASHHQAAAERNATLRKLGAVGTMSIPNPAHMDIPWARAATSRSIASMTLDDAALDDFEARQRRQGPCRDRP